jgi:hypothetical protein
MGITLVVIDGDLALGKFGAIVESSHGTVPLHGSHVIGGFE